MNPDINNPSAFALPGLPQGTPEAEKNDRGPDDQGQLVDTEEPGYDSVPPKQTVTVSVRYRVCGRGQPLPYPLDEAGGQ